MGYQTDFSGELSIEPPMTAAHIAYVRAFNDTRHMELNAPAVAVAIEAGTFDDSLRIAVGLPVGAHGEYVVGVRPENLWNSEHLDQFSINRNGNQALPGIWCEWTVNAEGTKLSWDEGEKFYDYDEWLRWLLALLAGWGYTLNGQIYWNGDESDDMGLLEVTDNVLAVKHGSVVYG